MPKKRKTTSPEESGVDLDLGGMFRGLTDFVEAVGKLAEAGGDPVERRGEFRVKGLGDEARGVYGFSIRSGIAGGKPRVEPFGNVHTSDDGLVVDDVREPLVDVFEEDEEIVITAELPGVAEEAISVRFDGDVVVIETSGDRRYAKETLLPTPVGDDADIQQSYNNGVLEIRVRKGPQQ